MGYKSRANLEVLVPTLMIQKEGLRVNSTIGPPGGRHTWGWRHAEDGGRSMLRPYITDLMARTGV